MPYLISYDIEDNNRRLKVANRLLQAGFIRLQKSVFVGDPREVVMRELTVWLKKNGYSLDVMSTDCIFVLNCTQNQLESAQMLGEPPTDWGDFLEPPNTLII